MNFFLEHWETIIWIAIVAIAIICIIKLVKKAIATITLIIFLIISGFIPYSTVSTAIDATKTTYQKTAALWSIETTQDQNGNQTDKVIYLFNKIPIEIKTSND